MAEPTINLGNGNWAGKSGNTLGYYKEGERFYKQDFTFSRSTTGTYTDSDGYIQDMPYNLLQYSEDFSNSFWTKTNTTVTSGFVSPNNTNNAFKLIASANDGQLIFSAVATGNSNTKAISVFAKANTTTSKLRIIEQYYSGHRTDFDLNLGTIIYSNSGGTSSIENVGNGWYRCTHIQTYSSGQNFAVFAFRSALPDSFLIWGAQLEEGTSAKTYFPTTTRLNIPRVDYLNNSKGSLILEPQRSNLVTYSSDFSHSSYIRNQTTATTGFISPDGNLNAYKLLEDNTNNIHRIYQTATVTGSPNTTISVYVKYLGRKNVLMRIADSTVGRWYDIENGVLGGIYQGAPDNSSIEYVSNGWYRISITHTVSNQCRLELWVSNTESTSAYQGDTTKGVYLFGAQLEVGSYPTSYIPTSGSSVTRNADACSMTNASDRINSSEGVLFIETSYVNKGYGNSIAITDGTNSQRVQVYFNNNDLSLLLVVKVNDTIVGTHTVSSSGINFEDTNKIAIKYKTNDMSFWLNGTKVAEDTSGTMFSANTLTKLGFDSGNGGSFYGKCNQIQVYNTALSNSELAELTTL